MGILQFIQINIRILLSNIRNLFVSYILMPLVLILVFTFLSSDMMHSSSIQDVNVQIADHDNSQLSAELKTFLTSEPFVEDEEDPDYVITIPAGYQEDMLSLKGTQLKLEEQRDISYNKYYITKNLIDQYNQSLSEALAIRAADDLIDKERLIEEITQLKLADYTVGREMSYERAGGLERNALALSGFVFFMIAMSISTANYMATAGMRQRVSSLPVSVAKLHLFNYLEAFIHCLISMLMFNIMLMIMGEMFRSHIVFMLGVTVVQAALCAAISMVVSEFLPKGVATVLYMVIILGEMFTNLEAVAVFDVENIKQFMPGAIVRRLYDVAISGAVADLLPAVMMTMAAAAVCYVVVLVKNQIQWRRLV